MLPVAIVAGTLVMVVKTSYVEMHGATGCVTRALHAHPVRGTPQGYRVQFKPNALSWSGDWFCEVGTVIPLTPPGGPDAALRTTNKWEAA